MAAIRITSISDLEHGTSGPGRTNYQFVVEEGDISQVQKYFKKYPSPKKWMEDVCIYGSNIPENTDGCFTDLAGSAKQIQIGDVLTLE